MVSMLTCESKREREQVEKKCSGYRVAQQWRALPALGAEDLPFTSYHHPGQVARNYLYLRPHKAWANLLASPCTQTMRHTDTQTYIVNLLKIKITTKRPLKAVWPGLVGAARPSWVRLYLIDNILPWCHLLKTLHKSIWKDFLKINLFLFYV